MALLAGAACAGSVGYEPTRPRARAAPDPDTEPLPAGAKTTIVDPRATAPEPSASPPPAPVASTSAAASATVAGPPADAGVALAKPKPKPAPVVSAPAAAATATDCGTKENPCPMQKVMRGMAAASTPEALEAAFNRVAALSPNAGWAWTSIAKKGAELAKSGDAAAAKAQCKACHDQHREAYKAQYRARKL
jgi:hypothetical protein